MADRITWVAPASSGFMPRRSHATRAYSSVALCGRQFAGVKVRREEYADNRCPKCEARA